eukprot:g10702.t1 g10702   contig4:2375383-2376001(+)
MTRTTLVFIAALATCQGFAPASLTSFTRSVRLSTSPLDVLDLTMNSAPLDAVSSLNVQSSDVIGLVSSSMVLSETDPWVQPLALVLGPFLNLFSFAMLCRIVLSWYPTANVNEVPFNIVVWPTEPLLRLVRGSVPPAFGVDITPVVWLGVFTFVNEILLGQQGLLTMKMKYGI